MALGGVAVPLIMVLTSKKVIISSPISNLEAQLRLNSIEKKKQKEKMKNVDYSQRTAVDIAAVICSLSAQFQFGRQLQTFQRKVDEITPSPTLIGVCCGCFGGVFAVTAVIITPNNNFAFLCEMF